MEEEEEEGLLTNNECVEEEEEEEEGFRANAVNEEDPGGGYSGSWCGVG